MRNSFYISLTDETFLIHFSLVPISDLILGDKLLNYSSPSVGRKNHVSDIDLELDFILMNYSLSSFLHPFLYLDFMRMRGKR